jgi:hypothetical protein
MKNKNKISKKIILNYVEALLKNDVSTIPPTVKKAIRQNPTLRKKVLELYWSAKNLKKEPSLSLPKAPAKASLMQQAASILWVSKFRFQSLHTRYFVYKRLMLSGALGIILLAVGFYFYFYFYNDLAPLPSRANLARIVPDSSNLTAKAEGFKAPSEAPSQESSSAQPLAAKKQSSPLFSQSQNLPPAEKDLLFFSNLRGQDPNSNYEFFLQPAPDSLYAAGQFFLSFSLFSAQTNQYYHQNLEVEVEPLQNQQQSQIFELAPKDFIYTFEAQLPAGEYRLLIYRKNGLNPICKPFTFRVK